MLLWRIALSFSVIKLQYSMLSYPCISSCIMVIAKEQQEVLYGDLEKVRWLLFFPQTFVYNISQHCCMGITDKQMCAISWEW